jgi:acetyl-CoA synthetase
METTVTNTRLATGLSFADTALAQFLRDHDYADLAELLAASAADPARFWQQVVEALGIEWARPWNQVLDLSQGPMWPRWFVGAKIDLYDNLVGRIAREDPHRPALRWEGDDGTTRCQTYAELDAEARQLAAGLAGIGIRAGDRIALYLPMIPEAAATLLAATRLGAIVLPLFSGYGADSVATRLQDSGASLLICADGYLRRGKPVRMLEEARSAAAVCPSLRHILVVPRLALPASPPPQGCRWQESDYRQIVATAVADDGPAIHDPNAPLMLIYTSGTTGKPKGVMHTHTGFAVKAAQDLLMAFDLKPRDTLAWVTDMGWMMGPWLVFGGLLRGATLLFFEGTPDHPTPRRIWDLARRHGVTHLGISPTLVRLLMAAGAPALPEDLPDTLRVFGSTGEPWNEDPWLWLFDTVGRGRRPIINYSGGTEIGGGILACFAGLPQKPCGFVGPIPGIAADVADGEGRPLAGEVGELVIRAPWPGMAHGFWQDDDRYVATYWSRFPSLWVHGDWARKDEDGHWFIQGRSDDTLKIAGKRVGPAEYESALVAHPLVAEAVAIGVPDPVKGEAVVCFVTVADAGRAAAKDWPAWEQELAGHVAARLGKPLRPEHVHLTPSLPKTRNGKVLRRLVRSAYLGLEAGDTTSLEDPASLGHIRACCPEAVPG